MKFLFINKPIRITTTSNYGNNGRVWVKVPTTMNSITQTRIANRFNCFHSFWFIFDNWTFIFHFCVWEPKIKNSEKVGIILWNYFRNCPSFVCWKLNLFYIREMFEREFSSISVCFLLWVFRSICFHTNECLARIAE
jgi:hypothetical protein